MARISALSAAPTAALLLLVTLSLDASEIEGERWRLAELHGEAVAPPPNRPAPHLTVEDGRAAGSDGCNRFGGPAKIDGEKIALGPLAGTLMACTDYPGAEKMGSALAAARTWRRSADRLELLGEDGAVVAAFVAE
jgi:heat shock protein HslJ